MIETIAEHFGNLTLQSGKKHKFLGIKVEFLADGKLFLFMKDYIKESIDLFEKELSTEVSSPENKGLKNIDESSTRLDK